MLSNSVFHRRPQGLALLQGDLEGVKQRLDMMTQAPLRHADQEHQAGMAQQAQQAAAFTEQARHCFRIGRVSAEYPMRTAQPQIAGAGYRFAEQR